MPSVAARQQPVSVSARSITAKAMDTRSSTSSNMVAHPPLGATTSKKGKSKKNANPVDTNKLLEETVARLERDVAGTKEEELEIEREVKKAGRELNHQISGLDNPLARIDAVQKKYSQLLGEMKRLEREHQKAKKRADTLQKERDSAKSELTRMISMKEKLEKLSRDTNQENKKLRAEVNEVKTSEIDVRKQLEDKLNRMVLDVEDVMQSKEQAKEQAETFETDELFRQKFKSFVEQYELRELHFTSILRSKDLEIEYHKAKLVEQRKAQEAESSKSHQLTRQVSTFSQTETELRSQLNIYVEKFKQVEDTLNNSNDLFLTFRKEMEEMSKKTKRLEKENMTLTRKHEATNANILKMAEDRTRANKEIEILRKQNEKLEKLCRGMQAQGRGQVPAGEDDERDHDDEDGTESEYEEYEEEDAYEGAEYEIDTEEEAVEAQQEQQARAQPQQQRANSQRPTFGPPRPYSLAENAAAGLHSKSRQSQPIGHQQQQVNGVKA